MMQLQPLRDTCLTQKYKERSMAGTSASLASCHDIGSLNAAQQGSESPLLQLPSHLLERVILMAGSGGAGACSSCRAVAEAWRAVTTPVGAARYLMARYGPHAAVQRVYGCPGLLKAVTRGAPRHAHDALALGVLRALCEAGCSTAGQTDAVLVNAAAAGHVAVARWAMQEGATAHERALRAACTHGQTEVVQLLLNTIVAAGAAAVSSAGAAAVSSAGADQAGSGAGAGGAGGADGGPALSPIWGLRLARSPSLTTRELHLSLVLNTALGGAATWGHKEVVELLLQAGADAQHDQSTALRFAATWGNEEALAALLAAGADPRDAEGAALLAAAKFGYGGIVRQLLAAGADAAARESAALCVAAQYGHEEVVSELLAAGADGAARGSLPLCLAALKGREGVVRQLLDWGVPYASRDGAALMMAAQEGHAGVVRILLRAGTWPRCLKHRALHVAARRGQLAAAQELAAAGAFAGFVYVPPLWQGVGVFGRWLFKVCCHVGAVTVPVVVLRRSLQQLAESGAARGRGGGGGGGGAGGRGPKSGADRVVLVLSLVGALCQIQRIMDMAM